MDAKELLAAIKSAPDDPERWTVYADSLLQQGDQRGELINLELAVEHGLDDPQARRRINEMLRDPSWLVSPRLRDQMEHWTLEFWRGCIRRARLRHGAGEEAIDALVADPHALVVSLRAPDVEHLSARLHEALPLLEALDISDGAADFESLVHPRLRVLRGDLHWCSALTEGRFDLPALEELDYGELDNFVGLRDPGELMVPTSIFQRPPPRLTTLTISAHQLDCPHDWFVDELADSTLAKQLRNLRIAPSCDDLAERLVERASAFPMLEELTIEGFEPLGTDALAAAFPRATVTLEQWEGDGDDFGDDE